VGLYVLFPGGCRWGEPGEGLVGSVDGVVGPGVSKTEEIKASVAWVSPANRASAWCFRRVFGVFSVGFGGALHQPGLISSVLDTWWGQCAVLASGQG